MTDGGVTCLHSAVLGTVEAGLNSIPVNNFSFLHQLSTGLADGAVASYTTYSIRNYNIMIIRAFLLMVEMQMCGWVIFALAESHFFDSNSTAINALGLNSLLSFSFTLYYLTL